MLKQNGPLEKILAKHVLIIFFGVKDVFNFEHCLLMEDNIESTSRYLYVSTPIYQFLRL